ncbi:MAG: YicC family protein [Burkholderiaceae bacterium]|nr:YicC family protein [Burkholderiaceae bacterium]MCD8536687.1 YicC family protein [Burkholderiaceae bacterium]MCD8566316.1 YicC family protein [Burkholderiaceae bacterium]
MKSMTGYGNAQASNDNGSVTIELRSVNSRYLDLQFRMPDELRMAEMPLRELLSKTVVRGKIEVRASYSRIQKDISATLSPAMLEQVRKAHDQIKQQLPLVQTPTFADVLQWTDVNKAVTDPMQWVPLALHAAQQALSELVQTREREGARLVEVIKGQAQQANAIVAALKSDLPALLQSQSDRVAKRMREAFDQACPEGLSHIRPEEISERLAAEAGLFSLRADVAEELDRLTLHLTELEQALDNSSLDGKGVGKRLDFLFQEMNREANTLGSKAVDMRLTRAAIDLKLLIEQMREQIQNIE